MSKRRTFTREFKFEAVRALKAGQKPPADIARELGIARNKLYSWQTEIDEYGEDAFPGSGRKERQAPSKQSNSHKQELERLRKENESLKEDLAILKKAAIYFAKDH